MHVVNCSLMGRVFEKLEKRKAFKEERKISSCSESRFVELSSFRVSCPTKLVFLNIYSISIKIIFAYV